MRLFWYWILITYLLYFWYSLSTRPPRTNHLEVLNKENFKLWTACEWMHIIGGIIKDAGRCIPTRSTTFQPTRKKGFTGEQHAVDWRCIPVSYFWYSTYFVEIRYSCVYLRDILVYTTTTYNSVTEQLLLTVRRDVTHIAEETRYIYVQRNKQRKVTRWRFPHLITHVYR